MGRAFTAGFAALALIVPPVVASAAFYLVLPAGKSVTFTSDVAIRVYADPDADPKSPLCHLFKVIGATPSTDINNNYFFIASAGKTTDAIPVDGTSEFFVPKGSTIQGSAPCAPSGVKADTSATLYLYGSLLTAVPGTQQ